MPAAVTFKLESFEGPLDLLLHLLSKNKVDIIDIPIAEILEQYLDYIRRMREFNMEVASEFIAMAAQLMYIKSKMLLPSYEEEAEGDPRAALVDALIEYQQFKDAGSILAQMGDLGRDLFVRPPEILEKDKSDCRISCSPQQLMLAIESILDRLDTRRPPQASAFTGIVERESVPVGDKLNQLISLFKRHNMVDFEALVRESKSRSELVALFLAVLELSKSHKILIEDNPGQGYTLRLCGPEDDSPAEADDMTEADDGN